MTANLYWYFIISHISSYFVFLLKSDIGNKSYSKPLQPPFLFKIETLYLAFDFNILNCCVADCVIVIKFFHIYNNI